MASNPLKQAVKAADGANAHLLNLFNRIGNAEHPRGVVPTAYRNAHRAMRSALKAPDRLTRLHAADEVMSQMKLVVRAELAGILADAQDYGVAYAARQLRLYDFEAEQADRIPMALHSQVQSGMDGALAPLDQQKQAITSMLAVGVDDDMILGDEDRTGALRVGDVIGAATFWTSTLLWSAFELAVSGSTGYSLDRQRIGKLAVAALDARTTDCCLRIHGQTQPFYKPFHLTGTPRYADRLDWSPFHRYCRTSIALYLADYDDGITENMKSAASRVRARRGTP